MSMEEVHLLVAIHNLENLRNLELLGNAGVSLAPPNPKLPSWVADWSNDNDKRSLIAVGSAPARFHAAGDSKAVLSISEDKTILMIRGFVVDTVSRLNITYVTRDRIDNDPTSEQSQLMLGLEEKKATDSCVALAEDAHKFPEGYTREEAFMADALLLQNARDTSSASPKRVWNRVQGDPNIP